MDLDGTSVYISGGASGLGAATVQRFSDAGATVGILDSDVERGLALAERVGGVFVSCDVASAESTEAAFAVLRARIGPPRVAVACAGVAAGRKLISRAGPYPLADFERVLGVNLVGTLNLVRLAA